MKKICLVGCGSIGRLHAKNLADKAELCFYSRTRASAQAFSGEFGGGRVFDSYEEVLDSAVDAVLISTPPEAHRVQVIDAIEAGKGVLVEKPLCATAEDLVAIGAVAAAQDKSEIFDSLTSLGGTVQGGQFRARRVHALGSAGTAQNLDDETVTG